MHPYSKLPARQYWRGASARWARRDFAGIYSPKFPITRETRIATAGSCFAQHVSKSLRKRGYHFLDLEPPPALLPRDLHADFGYGLYSARYGNVYTTRQLLQLLAAAEGSHVVDEVWETGARFYDPLRPSIEPNGFGSTEEVLALRQAHLAAVRRLTRQAEVFVFTLGLTEVWCNKASGLAYPSCPGTVAGTFDGELHAFQNLRFSEVLRDMLGVIRHWKKINKGIQFLLTVSPVPLVATAESTHVVASTTYSKSVLRAVAGELCNRFDFVDYFPSYELVTSHLSKGSAYAADGRTIQPGAVDEVMRCFFAAHGDEPSAELIQAPAPASEDETIANEMRVVCDEATLDNYTS